MGHSPTAQHPREVLWKLADWFKWCVQITSIW